MEKDKKKGGAGRIVLIVLAVIAALGAAGYFGLRALIRSKMDEINSVSLATTRGQEAPDFALPLTDGSEAKLSELLQDKEVVVLNIFASWCGPCKAEMPYIKKTWEDFAGDRFDVVSVAVSDKREDTVKALEKLDMPWHQILDAQKIPSELYGVNAIPHLILFAPDGTILKRGLRGEQIYSTVAEILNQ